MLFIYADGGKYLSILLCKQMLRLWDWSPFCGCDFPTANSNYNKLSGEIFSEEPPASIFFSMTFLKQSPTDLVCLARIQVSFWFFYAIYMNSTPVNFIQLKRPEEGWRGYLLTEPVVQPVTRGANYWCKGKDRHQETEKMVVLWLCQTWILGSILHIYLFTCYCLLDFAVLEIWSLVSWFL